MTTSDLRQRFGVQDMVSGAAQSGPSKIDSVGAYNGGNRVPPPPSDSGGWGQGEPNMEARVSVLEANVDHIKRELDRLSGVPADLSGMKVAVENLPTKDWVDTRLTGLLIKTGVTFGIFNAIMIAIMKLT